MRDKLLFVLFATLGAACGGGGANPDAQMGEAAAGAQEAGTSSPYCTSKPAVASVTDLSGTWVMRLIGSQVVSPGFVAAFKTQTVFYILMTIKQTGTTVVADGHYCDRTEIDPPTSLAPVVIPDQWAHTEKVVNRTGTFAPGSDGLSYVLDFPQLTEVAGANIDPANQSLPTHADDLGVIDEDGDGHPGITVNLNGQLISGSLYSVQEQKTSVVAIAVAPDRVEGALAFWSTQNVIGSNPLSLSDPTSLVGQALTKPGAYSSDPILCNSTFAMVKVADALAGSAADGGDVDAGAIDAGEVDSGAVDGGGASACAWVRANEAVLFP
jgi:hypothetical protein